GVGFLAVEGDGVALNAFGAEDCGEREAETLEDRTLLDVKLEIGGDVLALARGVAYAVDVDVALGESGFEANAVAIGAYAVGGDRMRAGEGGGAEEGAAEARAFLVRPVDDAEGEGRAAVVLASEGSEGFQRGDDAERAVE